MNSSNKFKVFILGHSVDKLYYLADKPFLEKINLNDLILPIPNTNHLAENRFFLLNESYFNNCPDYIGTLTYSFGKKYPHLNLLQNMQNLENVLSPQIVYAAAPTNTIFKDKKWLERTFIHHKTIEKYMQEISNVFFKKSLHDSPSFLANNFICHKNVFFEFIKFFKQVFYYMHKKYGYNFDITTDDTNRTAAYLYERVTMIYFSNRNDLDIIQWNGFPKNPSTFDFDFNSICWIATSGCNYVSLYNIWYNSLIEIGVKKENIKHQLFTIPNNMNANLEFKSSVWYFSIEKRIEYYIHTLEKLFKNNQYKYFILSDCDIQFFKNKEKIWKRVFLTIDPTDFNIYFPSENNKSCANCGFYLIKKENIHKAIQILEFVLQKIKSTPIKNLELADQTIINENWDNLNCGVLPHVIVQNGPVFIPENKHTILFHHATGTCGVNDLENKLTQIQNIKNLMI